MEYQFNQILLDSYLRHENAKSIVELGLMDNMTYQKILEPIINEEVRKIEEIFKCH
jgi:hypothetical protein